MHTRSFARDCSARIVVDISAVAKENFSPPRTGPGPTTELLSAGADIVPIPDPAG